MERQTAQGVVVRPTAIAVWLAAAVATFAVPATASEFEQVWFCELKPGSTLDDIIVSHSENRFDFVVRAPSLAERGAFYDTYEDGTPVAIADLKFADVASCSGSTMWESIGVD
jgi:hypothetical protein